MKKFNALSLMVALSTGQLFSSVGVNPALALSLTCNAVKNFNEAVVQENHDYSAAQMIVQLRGLIDSYKTKKAENDVITAQNTVDTKKYLNQNCIDLIIPQKNQLDFMIKNNQNKQDKIKNDATQKNKFKSLNRDEDQYKRDRAYLNDILANNTDAIKYINELNLYTTLPTGISSYIIQLVKDAASVKLTPKQSATLTPDQTNALKEISTNFAAQVKNYVDTFGTFITLNGNQALISKFSKDKPMAITPKSYYDFVKILSDGYTNLGDIEIIPANGDTPHVLISSLQAYAQALKPEQSYYTNALMYGVVGAAAIASAIYVGNNIYEGKDWNDLTNATNGLKMSQEVAQKAYTTAAQMTYDMANSVYKAGATDQKNIGEMSFADIATAAQKQLSDNSKAVWNNLSESAKSYLEGLSGMIGYTNQITHENTDNNANNNVKDLTQETMNQIFKEDQQDKQDNFNWDDFLADFRK